MSNLLSELEAVVSDLVRIDTAQRNGNHFGTQREAIEAANRTDQFLRTHHAEIAEAVRDTEAYRQLVAGIDAEQFVAASKKHGDALGVLKDAARYRFIRLRLWPSEVEDSVDTYPGAAALDLAVCEDHGKQIDAAIDATMSAREGE